MVEEFFQQTWLEDVGKYTLPHGPMEQCTSSRVRNPLSRNRRWIPKNHKQKEKCIPTILEFHFSFRGCSLSKISPSLVSCVEKLEEFMILPVGAGSFREALQIGAEVASCTTASMIGRPVPFFEEFLNRPNFTIQCLLNFIA